MRHTAARSLTGDPTTDCRKAPPRVQEEVFSFQHDLARVLAEMPLEERHLAEGLMRHTVTQLARLQRRHRQRLHEAIRRIRRRFEDAGLRHYLG